MRVPCAFSEPCTKVSSSLITAQSTFKRMHYGDGNPEPSPLPQEESVERGDALPWGFWGTMGFTVLALAAVFTGQLAVGLVFFLYEWVQDPSMDWMIMAEELAGNGLLIGAAGLVSAPVGLGAVWLFARMRNGIRPVDYLGLAQFPVGLSALWLLVLGTYQMSVALAASIFQPPDNATSEFMVQLLGSASFRPLLWLSVVVLIPISEEVIFRGFMFRGLLDSRLGAAGAVVLPSLVWGAIHLQYDLFGVLSIVGMGFILGMARLATGSTWTTIGLHVIWNGVAVLGTEIYLAFE